MNHFQDIIGFGHGDFSDEEIADKIKIISDTLGGGTQPDSDCQPTVSIVVPAYREEKKILGLLMSLAMQLRDFSQKAELIIVTNGQPYDNPTREIAEASGIATVIHESRKGIANARQVGLNNAKGKIYVSTDADTIHPPKWLESIDANFNNPNIILSQGGIGYYDSSIDFTIYRTIVDIYKKRIERRLMGDLFEQEFYVHGSNSAFLRDAAIESGGYPRDCQWAEDSIIADKILQRNPFSKTSIHDEVGTSARRFANGRFLQNTVDGFARRLRLVKNERPKWEKVYYADYR